MKVFLPPPNAPGDCATHHCVPLYCIQSLYTVTKDNDDDDDDYSDDNTG